MTDFRQKFEKAGRKIGGYAAKTLIEAKDHPKRAGALVASGAVVGSWIFLNSGINPDPVCLQLRDSLTEFFKTLHFQVEGFTTPLPDNMIQHIRAESTANLEKAVLTGNLDEVSRSEPIRQACLGDDEYYPRSGGASFLNMGIEGAIAGLEVNLAYSVIKDKSGKIKELFTKLAHHGKQGNTI